jgi:selenide,water dikinase
MKQKRASEGGGSMRLTETSPGGGCGCKLSSSELSQVLLPLADLMMKDRPADLLVGAETRDDAAVYRIDDSMALVFTADFFTPVVDDPYDWGRIAAANALSDVYAMGGRPLMCLNLLAWPRASVADPMLAAVLQGGMSAVMDAKCVLAGGHSIEDSAPKFGMAVLGMASPDQLIRNSSAEPGMDLVLTKAIGSGVVSTAIKRNLAEPSLVARATKVMAELNAGASEVALRCHVRAGTDVTGFGLLGHLRELCDASGCSAIVVPDRVPQIEGASSLFTSGIRPDGCMRNRLDLETVIDWGQSSEVDQLLLCDPQSSGGLLLATDDGNRLIRELAMAGVSENAIVGRTVERSSMPITLAPTGA